MAFVSKKLRDLSMDDIEGMEAAPAGDAPKVEGTCVLQGNNLIITVPLTHAHDKFRLSEVEDEKGNRKSKGLLVTTIKIPVGTEIGMTMADGRRLSFSGPVGKTLAVNLSFDPTKRRVLAAQ